MIPAMRDSNLIELRTPSKKSNKKNFGQTEVYLSHCLSGPLACDNFARDQVH